MQSEIASCLEENRNLLYEVQEELNMARKNLPDIATIIDEDMDPKNVMWNKGKPFVIDLECLDYGNPFQALFSYPFSGRASRCVISILIR